MTVGDEDLLPHSTSGQVVIEQKSPLIAYLQVDHKKGFLIIRAVVRDWHHRSRLGPSRLAACLVFDCVIRSAALRYRRGSKGVGFARGEGAPTNLNQVRQPGSDWISNFAFGPGCVRVRIGILYHVGLRSGPLLPPVSRIVVRLDASTCSLFFSKGQGEDTIPVVPVHCCSWKANIGAFLHRLGGRATREQ